MSAQIRLAVVDEMGELEQVIGNLDKENLEAVIKASEQSKFKCLPYVDINDNTYFNEYQCLEILKEIEELNNKNLDQATLKLISQGAKITTSDVYQYLKFSPVDFSILIKKIAEKEGIGFYSVISPEMHDLAQFYIGIDPHKKIYFFKNKNFEKPDFIFDLEKREKNNLWVPSRVLEPLLWKIAWEIDHNNFPTDISYHS